MSLHAVQNTDGKHLNYIGEYNDDDRAIPAITGNLRRVSVSRGRGAIN